MPALLIDPTWLPQVIVARLSHTGSGGNRVDLVGLPSRPPQPTRRSVVRETGLAGGLHKGADVAGEPVALRKIKQLRVVACLASLRLAHRFLETLTTRPRQFGQPLPFHHGESFAFEVPKPPESMLQTVFELPASGAISGQHMPASCRGVGGDEL